MLLPCAPQLSQGLLQGAVLQTAIAALLGLVLPRSVRYKPYIETRNRPSGREDNAGWL